MDRGGILFFGNKTEGASLRTLWIMWISLMAMLTRVLNIHASGA